jgi:hypothetical protein
MRKLWNYVINNKIVIGTIWGIATTIISLYLGFYPPEKESLLTVYQINSFDAFTVKTASPDLQILLNGQDIRKDSLNLKVFKLKLINNGDQDIKESDFDREGIFGIKVINGHFVRIDEIEQGEGTLHIISHVSLLFDSTVLRANKVFIGKGDYITFDIWVLHSASQKPILQTMGRIANTTFSLTTDEESDSTLQDLLLGLFYIALATFGIWLFFYLLELIVKTGQKAIRAFLFKRRMGYHYNSSNKIHRFMLRIYTRWGQKEFISALATFTNSEKCSKAYKEALENERFFKKMEELYNRGTIHIDKSKGTFSIDTTFLSDIEFFEESGMIKKSDTAIYVEEELMNEIKQMIKQFGANLPE